MNNYSTIDEYISNFPPKIQSLLQEVRQTIKTLVPEGTEAISYGIPTINFNGHLVHFAAYATHFALYPASDELIAEFPEFEQNRTGKGTLQFPLDKPIPMTLVKKFTKFRLRQQLARIKKK